jgi:hypothetical protein
MKKLLITTASMMLVAVSTYAQGTINFANLVISGGGRVVDAPIRDSAGNLASGAGFQAQLYARAVGGPNFEAVGAAANFLTGTGAGYFLPGTRTYAGVAAGASAEIQVRAWQVSSGATWENATVRGNSAPITIPTGGNGSPPAPPALLTGLASFQIVPEPSTIALGIIGGLGTLMLIRRRK